MNDHSRGRRGFLQGAAAGVAALGSGPLWSWASERQGPPPDSRRDTGNWASIPTMEHFGDLNERLEIPPSWDLTVCHMAGHDTPVLSAAEIRQRIEAPIGTKRLSDIARGKSTAVITFDDLTRPTPTFEIVPHVIAELQQAGIKDENIMFLGSFGSHCPLRQADVAAKLGWETVAKYPWVNHNVWENHADLGRTPRGNRVKVNQHFMNADVRVTISGIKRHALAGYGGGAKAILPGIAWIESIDYFHRIIGRRNSTTGPGKIFKNEVRLDMVDAARLAKVDYSVQAVFNGYRKVIGVYSGDIEQAHHAACRHANRVLRTEPIKGADVIIANSTPTAMHAYDSVAWLREVRDGGSVVLIAQHPQTIETLHYATERWSYTTRAYYEMVDFEGFNVKQAAQFIIYSQYMQARDIRRFQKGAVVTRTWADTVAAVRKVHRDSPRVVLYPYAGLQHRPLDMDG